jgi:hypothetical protein
MSPRYDRVPDEPQLPSSRPRLAPSTAEASSPVEPWVAITTTVPTSVRRELSIACAVHDKKLKDVVTEALQTWLDDHPVR